MKFFKLGFQSADLHISHAKSWHILLAVGLGTIMVPINASIVNVSLPTITEFFGANISTSEWVLTSYLIILLSFVLFSQDLAIFGAMSVFILQAWSDLQ